MGLFGAKRRRLRNGIFPWFTRLMSGDIEVIVGGYRVPGEHHRSEISGGPYFSERADVRSKRYDRPCTLTLTIPEGADLPPAADIGSRTLRIALADSGSILHEDESCLLDESTDEEGRTWRLKWSASSARG